MKQMKQMDCLVNLSSPGTDFSELDAIFGSDALISILNSEGIYLAANQRALAFYGYGPEAFGKHADALFEGYCFERMDRPRFDHLLRTGIPNIVTDRVLPNRQHVIVRVRSLMLRIPWGPGSAVLAVSHIVDDFMVAALRSFNPKSKMISNTVSGMPMRWVDFETLYLALRCGSTKEIATLLRRSEDAVRLRLQALADYMEKTASAMGYTIAVPPTLKGLHPFLRHWPINDAVLAGCITGLNARHGKNVVSIAGFDAERKVVDAPHYDDLLGASAAEIMQAILKAKKQ